MSTPLNDFEGLDAVTLASQRTIDVPCDGVSQIVALVSATNAGTSGATTLTITAFMIGADDKLYAIPEEDTSGNPVVAVAARSYTVDMTATAEHLQAVFIPAPGSGTMRLAFDSDTPDATDDLNVYIERAAL